MRLTCVACVLCVPILTCAQESKSTPPARIIVSSPLAIAADSPVRLLLRGTHLDEITEIRITGRDVKVEIASKGKAMVPPNYDVKKVGDTQAEIKFTLPPDTAQSSLQLVAITASGAGPAYELALLTSEELLEEKEPNDGFKSAQPLVDGKTVVGTIHEPRNVDVFEVKVEAGQKLVVTVRAAQVGSLLDPVLTIYDSAGQIVASSDDADGKDPRIESTVSKSGSYYLSLQDANDSGGPHFAYTLKVVKQ